MAVFGELSDDGLIDNGDQLGGGGILESGVYDAIVKLAFVTKSKSSNAMGVECHFDIDGFTSRETFWVTNKEGKNYYVKDDKKIQLMGYNIMNSLCLLTTGFPLSEQEDEEKVVKLYDFEAKKELPKSVQVFTEVINKPITLGLLKQIVNKTVKDDSGKYVLIGDIREENVIDKFFHTSQKLNSS